MTREETVNYLNGYLTAASRREFFLEMAEEAREAGKRDLDELEEKAERESLVMQEILETIGGMGAESEKRVLFYRCGNRGKDELLDAAGPAALCGRPGPAGGGKGVISNPARPEGRPGSIR